MSGFELTYKRFGGRSILIEWPSEINEYVLYDVISYKENLLKSNIKYIVEIKSAYNSILINYNLTINNIYDKIDQLKSYYSPSESKKKPVSKLWIIPVCYDDEFALDLEELATAKSCSKDAIIEQHSSSIYTIYFIGFLPGFYYLGGLDKALHFPRRQSPRLQIKKGAVGIGGSQTGVYPNISPGGWNIIGNSPINFFDVTLKEPCFGQQGDKIQFKSVSKKEYDDIKTLVDAGVYSITNVLIDG